MPLPPDLAAALDRLAAAVAPGMRAQAAFHPDRRSRKPSATPENWAPEEGEIRITFVPQRKADPAAELVRALAAAEAQPELRFIALKWFRDHYLPQQKLTWTDSADERDRVLRQAIERGWATTCRVPNPKAPQFPTTAIQLNRLHPQVEKLVGAARPAVAEFAPVRIGGEPLSKTLLRDRR
jgi:hypothetical protein